MALPICYLREDGLYDIEAHLRDTKDYGYNNHSRGWIEKGEPLHGMWLRLTIDDSLVIQSCEAVTDHAPFDICPSAAPNFARLAGLKIGAGFNRAVNERVGGVHGCTHLREVLAQMATVAFQTINPSRRRNAKPPAAQTIAAPNKRPAIIGTCLAYAPDSPVVRKRWPEFADKETAG